MDKEDAVYISQCNPHLCVESKKTKWINKQNKTEKKENLRCKKGWWKNKIIGMCQMKVKTK